MDSATISINFNGSVFRYDIAVSDDSVTIHCCSATVRVSLPHGADPHRVARSEAVNAILDGRFRDPNSCTHQ